MQRLTLEEILETLAQVFDVASSEIDSNSSQDSIENWDSLGHLSLLEALDDRLDGNAGNVKLLSDATTVEKIYQALKEHNLAK